MAGPPTNKLKPRKYFRNEKCTKACSLNPVNWPGETGELCHAWFEAGDNNATIVEKSDALGHHVSNGAIGRHRANHLEPMEEGTPDPTNLQLDKVNHIEFLEQLVARSAKSMHFSNKVSPEMGIRAIEMIYKLTQGSQMDNFLAAVTQVMGGEDDEDEWKSPLELAEAQKTADEQEQSQVVGE